MSKDKYYWSQLRTSLSAGSWLSPSPAKSPKAEPLPWSELFRKFNKHCRGFEDVAKVAEQNVHLAQVLIRDKGAKDEDEDLKPAKSIV